MLYFINSFDVCEGNGEWASVHALTHKWRLEDNLRDLGVFPPSFGSQGSNSGHQAQLKGSELAEPSHWPQLLIIFPSVSDFIYNAVLPSNAAYQSPVRVSLRKMNITNQPHPTVCFQIHKLYLTQPHEGIAMLAVATFPPSPQEDGLPVWKRRALTLGDSEAMLELSVRLTMCQSSPFLADIH